ncbi:hypothetical protein AQUCO_02000039v1 [Aquilegia coerulea]|uniref:Uncharacterized protein n=1 Tax=Aquilegia coerulea TaxID=218851 RepID=A0A2G5DFQ5_AQUCA|nr:hypothetical protein AQUCO_02000039v1 [Aquilegia coerulea]
MDEGIESKRFFDPFVIRFEVLICMLLFLNIKYIGYDRCICMLDWSVILYQTLGYFSSYSLNDNCLEN